VPSRVQNAGTVAPKALRNIGVWETIPQTFWDLKIKRITEAAPLCHFCFLLSHCERWNQLTPHFTGRGIIEGNGPQKNIFVWFCSLE
jgi:hypothetical protein